MRSVLIALAILASGCRIAAKEDKKKPPCQSWCGTLLEHEGNGSISCEVLQEAEDTTLSAMDTLCKKDKRFCRKEACKALFGWQIIPSDAVLECDGKLGCYVGLSNCSTKQMFLFANQNWRKGSYPHELFHVTQDCQPPESWKMSAADAGPGHNGWTEHGVYWVIELIRRGFNEF